jgi:hypothetical protein
MKTPSWNRSPWIAVASIASWIALVGCDQDPFTLVIAEGGIPDASVPEAGCIPTNGGFEACDGADNDCDGEIDETFNLLNDPDNCGQCGNRCRRPGLLTICESGLCKNVGCGPGFYDLNDDLTDGCEYECTPTGDEVCDGADNDCNGEVDETFDLQRDVANCGSCGNVCQLANATARCEDATCRLQNCDAGFIDKDNEEDNGCEEACERTNNGEEICDGIDNDCNGVVDDPGQTPIDFTSDPINCGGCNIVCAFAHAAVACQQRSCVLVRCIEPWVDADGAPGNGCECEPSGPEKCDGLDNDCNGAVDDGLPNDLGACGETKGECEAGRLECRNSQLVCVGAKGREAELCDGKDNDCDGVIDNNLPESFGLCGRSEGECRLGKQVCQDGEIVCEGSFDGEPERCDGKDNDCNGAVDDLVELGVRCGSDIGECEPGFITCDVLQEKLVCTDQVGPAAEMCADSKDSDCDGNDELPTCVYAGTGREQRLDERTAAPGANNSVQLDVAGNGDTILAVWLDRRSGQGDIFGNLSTDGGRSWLADDVEIADEGESKAEPQVAFGGPRSGGQRAYLSYAGFTATTRRDVFVRRNTDGSWAEPIRVDSEERDSLFVRLAVHPGPRARHPTRCSSAGRKSTSPGLSGRISTAPARATAAQPMTPRCASTKSQTTPSCRRSRSTTSSSMCCGTRGAPYA